MSVLIVKQGDNGAILKEINRYTVIVFDLMLDAAEKFKRDYTLTEGWRPGTGYHPQNRAWDIRANNLPKEHRQELFVYLKDVFPIYFDIVLEEFPLDPARDHFHIEVDAKKLAKFIAEFGK